MVKKKIRGQTVDGMMAVGSQAIGVKGLPAKTRYATVNIAEPRPMM